jgi:hypothetical protein
MRARTGMMMLAAITVLAMGGAVAAQAAAPLSLTPRSSSTTNDIYLPLAGSASTLILSRHPYFARDLNESASADPFSSGPNSILVRTTAGHLRKLGTMPAYAESFSLVGGTLAAGKRIDDDTPVTNKAYVWKTATGKRTQITVPAGDVYLSAAPGGVLFATPKGKLRIRTTDGTTTTLATPFGPTTKLSIADATVDTSGAVVSDATGHVVFISFAAPHTMTTLQNPSPGNPVFCGQMAGNYAACATATYNDDDSTYDPTDPFIEPLNGGAPTVATISACTNPIDLAVAGSTELWTCVDTSQTKAAWTLGSITAGSSTSTLSSARRSFVLVSAYGKVVGADLAQDSLYEASTTTDVSPLVSVTPSPVTVDAFALTPTKLLYSDDERVASRKGQSESVFERTLRATTSAVHASAPRLIGGGAKKVTGNLIGISSSVRVFATRGPKGTSWGSTVLHVHTSHGTTTLSDAIGQGVVQVSGNRVLYQRPSGGGSDNVVYDAATKKTTVVNHVGGIDYTGIALSGHFAAYATKHGAIYRKDLLTGKRVLLRKALPNDVGGVEFDVYASGSWVGWHALPVSHELAKPLNQIRNVKTMAPAISLRHTLFSLTSAGSILDSTHATFRIGFSEMDQVAHASRFWLRSYSGHTRSLLPRASYVAGPQIAGDVLAWADAQGVLHARHV